jgi:hypothetical protein
MFAGHLGVVSLASAVILAVSTAQDGAVLWTILYMLLAVVVICAVAMSNALDTFICGAIAAVLKRLGWFVGGQHLVVTELPDGTQIAEHVAQHHCSVDAPNLGLMILRMNDDPPGSDTLCLTAGDRVLCFGPPTAHLALNAVTASR